VAHANVITRVDPTSSINSGGANERASERARERERERERRDGGFFKESGSSEITKSILRHVMMQLNFSFLLAPRAFNGGAGHSAPSLHPASPFYFVVAGQLRGVANLEMPLMRYSCQRDRKTYSGHGIFKLRVICCSPLPPLPRRFLDVCTFPINDSASLKRDSQYANCDTFTFVLYRSIVSGFHLFHLYDLLYLYTYCAPMANALHQTVQSFSLAGSIAAKARAN